MSRKESMKLKHFNMNVLFWLKVRVSLFKHIEKLRKWIACLKIRENGNLKKKA